MNKEEALRLISIEYDRATKLHGPIMSSHEAKAVIEEELDEYWDTVKAKQGQSDQALYELVQLGAMAVRSLVDSTTMIHR